MKKGAWIYFIILLLTLGFLPGCSNGSTNQHILQEVTYESMDNDGNKYILTITESPDRSAYTIQPGDTYILKIISPSGEIKTSQGVIQSAGSGSYTLLPSGTTVSFTVTVSHGTMTNLTGTITLENGETKESPEGILSPVQQPEDPDPLPDSENPFIGRWENNEADIGYIGLIFNDDFSGVYYQTVITGENTGDNITQNITLMNVDFVYEIIDSASIKINANGTGVSECTYLFSDAGGKLSITGLGTADNIIVFIKQNSEKTIVGVWTKTTDAGTFEVTVNANGTWFLNVDGVPYGNNPEHPGIWEGTVIKIWYDFISKTHTEPGYVSAAYTLSDYGNKFTLSGEAEQLLGGTDPWIRIRNL